MTALERAVQLLLILPDKNTRVTEVLAQLIDDPDGPELIALADELDTAARGRGLRDFGRLGRSW